MTAGRVVAGVLVALVVGVALVQWQSLVPPDPATAAGRARLAATARTARPLIAGLERYHRDHGRYPATLSGLSPAYLPSARGRNWHDWEYDPTWVSPEGYSHRVMEGYGLDVKVSIDPVLRYWRGPDGSYWEYDPGTGAPKTRLPPP